MAFCSSHPILPPSLTGQAYLCLESFSTASYCSQLYFLIPAYFLPDHSIQNCPKLFPPPVLYILFFFIALTDFLPPTYFNSLPTSTPDLPMLPSPRKNGISEGGASPPMHSQHAPGAWHPGYDPWFHLGCKSRTFCM